MIARLRLSGAARVLAALALVAACGPAPAPTASPEATPGNASPTPSQGTPSPGGAQGAPDAAQPTTPAPAPALALDEATRRYLWEMEHHSNLLVRYGFGVLRDALLAADRAALRATLSSDFTGSRPAAPVEVRHAAAGTYEGVRREDDGGPRTAITADDFTKFLIDARAAFGAPPRISFGVKKIFPTDRTDLDAPWSVLVELRLAGDEVPRAPREHSCVLRLRTARPGKERLAAGGWLLGADILDVETARADRPLFADVTDRLGMAAQRFHDNWETDRKINATGGVFACDYNRDGCTDLLITSVKPGGNALLRGRPDGGFADATRAAGLSSLRGGRPQLQAAFADIDGDGWEDLVFSHGGVWRGDGGHGFVDIASRSNLPALLADQSPAAISVADVDRDGRLDLYVARSGGRPTSWLDDTKDAPSRCQLLLNRGDWQFEDVTERTGTDGGARSAFTSLFFDANADGWPDIYVINEFGDGVLYVNEMAEGDGNRTFRAQDVDPDTGDFGTMGAACGDVDGDGRIDLYASSMYSKAGSRIMANMPPGAYADAVMQRLQRLISGSELYRNESGGGGVRFTARGEAARVHGVGWAWGATLSDFDNDGALDIFAMSGYMSRDRTKPDG